MLKILRPTWDFGAGAGVGAGVEMTAAGSGAFFTAGELRD